MSTLAATLPVPAELFVPRYDPHTSAARFRAAGTAEAARLFGVDVALTVSARQTGDAYALFELCCPPGAALPAFDAGRQEVTLYVLDGALRVRLDGAEFEAAAGSCVFAPRGVAFGFANAEDAPARALAVVSPGAGAERLFASLSAVARICGPGGGPTPYAAIASVCAAQGVRLLAS